jgi:Zn-dependent protease
MEILVSITILIFSVIVHEVAHGFMAERLGDPTAKIQGRLTLNPIKHIDPIGSIIVPAITFLFVGFIFGWAKPVVYNPYNLKNRRLGEFLIALAGPMSNLILALIFGFIFRYLAGFDLVSLGFLQVCALVVKINIVLALFNLIPVPPLDGSKLLFSILPIKYSYIRHVSERYSPILIFIVVFFLWNLIYPLINNVFKLIIGL